MEEFHSGSGLECKDCGPPGQWRPSQDFKGDTVLYSGSLKPIDGEVRAVVLLGDGKFPTVVALHVYYQPSTAASSSDKSKDDVVIESQIYVWNLNKEVETCKACRWTTPSKAEIIEFVQRLCTKTNCVIGFGSLCLEKDNNLITIDLKESATLLKLVNKQVKGKAYEQVPTLMHIAKLCGVPHHPMEINGDTLSSTFRVIVGGRKQNIIQYWREGNNYDCLFDFVLYLRVFLFEILRAPSLKDLWDDPDLKHKLDDPVKNAMHSAICTDAEYTGFEKAIHDTAPPQVESGSEHAATRRILASHAKRKESGPACAAQNSAPEGQSSSFALSMARGFTGEDAARSRELNSSDQE